MTKGEIFAEVRRHAQVQTSGVPPLQRQIVTAGKAAARWAAAGFPKRSDDELARIRSICERCEFWKAHPKLGFMRCEKCGCSALKHLWATEQCPVDKW
ncbi:MAG: hypothetical protein QOD99_1913 [Chthoniobacter sp.]|jgi:hypothetical protein|nr:hypothetical protein [Chthoniobacter sp.]